MHDCSLSRAHLFVGCIRHQLVALTGCCDMGMDVHSITVRALHVHIIACASREQSVKFSYNFPPCKDDQH